MGALTQILLPSIVVILFTCRGHRALARHLDKRSDNQGIVFEDEEDRQVECMIKMKLFWPPTGSCYGIASRGPCPENHWIVAKADPLQAIPQTICQKRPCINTTESFWVQDEKCYPKLDDGDGISIRLSPNFHPCPSSKGFQLVDDPYGQGVCECQQYPEVQIFWNQTQRCYPLYKQGPCSKREYLVYEDGPLATEDAIIFTTDEEDPAEVASHFKCRPNPCPEGLVPFQDGCYPLKSYDPCPGVSGPLDVSLKTLKLECLNGIRQLALVAPRNFCARGTVQDVLGNCKAVYGKFSGTSSF